MSDAANPASVEAAVLSRSSVPSYFDNPREAKKLRDEALSWIDTPFRPYYQVELQTAIAEAKEQGIDLGPMDLKGPHGGIDCVGLVSEIFSRIGATDPWMFPRTPADYQQHQLGDKVLNWLRGTAVIGNDDIGYSIEPQSEKLANYFQELDIPEFVTDRHAETPRDFFKPGDVLICRTGGLFHMPIIYDDDLHFVNSLPRLRVTEGTIQDATFSIHLVAVFRLRPRAKIQYPGAPA
jgi:cell wall-associated NlpC family hydrolase